MFKWLLERLRLKPKDEPIIAWPFPPIDKDFNPRPKRKYVKKATTRTAPKNETAKKAATKRKKAGK